MALKMSTANNTFLAVQVSNQDPAPGSDNYFRQTRYRHLTLMPDLTPPVEGQIWPRGNFTDTDTED